MRTMTVLLLLLVTTGATAQTKVYQWTDEDGVVHFSTEPPPDPDQAVEERMVSGAPKPGSVAIQTEAEAEAQAQADASARPAGGLIPGEPQVDPAEEARQRAERCDLGQRLVALIEPAQRFQKINADGSTEWLTGEARLAELENARQMVSENCQ
ncbi:MAG: DUF4124 domain-containing protein [Pseudomonadota bacterium]